MLKLKSSHYKAYPCTKNKGIVVASVGLYIVTIFTQHISKNLPVNGGIIEMIFRSSSGSHKLNLFSVLKNSSSFRVLVNKINPKSNAGAFCRSRHNFECPS